MKTRSINRRWIEGRKTHNLPDYGSSKKIEEFFNELFKLYEKYNISISHEDGHGGFKLETNCEYNKEWIYEASINEELAEEFFEKGDVNV